MFCTSIQAFTSNPHVNPKVSGIGRESQVTWSCCGVFSPEDFLTSSWLQEEDRGDTEESSLSLSWPLTCCSLLSPASYLSPLPRDLDRCHLEGGQSRMDSQTTWREDRAGWTLRPPGGRTEEDRLSDHLEGGQRRMDSQTTWRETCEC